MPAGVILANLAFLIVSRSLSPEVFQAWGWRVPFLLRAFIVLGGLIIRTKVDESPEFVKAREAAEKAPPR